MTPLIPIAAKILSSLLTSDASATPGTQKTGTDKAGAARDVVNFAQTVDDVSRNAAGATQQSAHHANRG